MGRYDRRQDGQTMAGLGQHQQRMRDAALHEDPRLDAGMPARAVERLADLEAGVENVVQKEIALNAALVKVSGLKPE